MLTQGALHRLAIDRPPVSRAFEFHSLTRAIIPTNRQVCVFRDSHFAICFSIDFSGLWWY